MLAKLQAGGANYDVIVPSDYMVKQMVELGLLEKLAPSSFPNGANIKPEFLDVYFDQGRQYTAPVHVRHDGHRRRSRRRSPDRSRAGPTSSRLTTRRPARSAR